MLTRLQCLPRLDHPLPAAQRHGPLARSDLGRCVHHVLDRHRDQRADYYRVYPDVPAAGGQVLPAAVGDTVGERDGRFGAPANDILAAAEVAQCRDGAGVALTSCWVGWTGPGIGDGIWVWRLGVQV